MFFNRYRLDWRIDESFPKPANGLPPTKNQIHRHCTALHPDRLFTHQWLPQPSMSRAGRGQGRGSRVSGDRGWLGAVPGRGLTEHRLRLILYTRFCGIFSLSLLCNITNLGHLVTLTKGQDLTLTFIGQKYTFLLRPVPT